MKKLLYTYIYIFVYIAHITSIYYVKYRYILVDKFVAKNLCEIYEEIILG